MSLMLGSVRSLAEAQLAFACGVDWIGVKDPLAGALGAAPVAVIREVVDFIAGRRPVSATLGDCWDQPEIIEERASEMQLTGVDFVKAGLRARRPTAAALGALHDTVAAGARIIVVCMAESSPGLDDIEALAGTGISGVMLDTADKSGPALPDLLDSDYLVAFVNRARELGMLSGLAGRLRIGDVQTLADFGADYLGFRSALCDASSRTSDVSRSAILAVREKMSALENKQHKQRNEVA